MNQKEARRILGITPDADPIEIKKAYRRLMLETHPDADVFSDGELTRRAQEINLAYSVLKKGASGPSHMEHGREHHSEAAKARAAWSAPLNEHAYREREILHYAEDSDGMILGSFRVAKGKYLWTTEEDFPLFLQSITRCGKELLDEIDDLRIEQRSGSPETRRQLRARTLAELVYLLAQQFIDASALLGGLARRKSVDKNGASIFYIPAMLELAPASGASLPASGETLYPSRLCRHRLYLKNAAGQELGYLSFPDDRLYYVVIPLFEQRRAQVRIQAADRQEAGNQTRKSRNAGAYLHLHLWLRLPAQSEGSLPENLNLQIEQLLDDYQRA